MIVAIVGTLEGFKAKLQKTIDHVKAGVTHLNEDQAEQAVVMINALRGEFDEVADAALEHLGHKPVGNEARIEAPGCTCGARAMHAADCPSLPRIIAGPDAQPVPEPLKSVVDENAGDGAEVVQLPSDWTQHDSAGHEVKVHVDNAGTSTARPIWGPESIEQQ